MGYRITSGKIIIEADTKEELREALVLLGATVTGVLSAPTARVLDAKPPTDVPPAARPKRSPTFHDHKCLRCKRTFQSRSKDPARCKKCGSSSWYRAIPTKEYTCLRCGHVWVPKYSTKESVPSQCQSCNSKNWNEPRVATVCAESVESSEPVLADSATCNHTWDLGTPNGPMAHGVCTKCGREEDFPNTTPAGEGSPWKRRGQVVKSDRRG